MWCKKTVNMSSYDILSLTNSAVDELQNKSRTSTVSSSHSELHQSGKVPKELFPRGPMFPSPKIKTIHGTKDSGIVCESRSYPLQSKYESGSSAKDVNSKANINEAATLDNIATAELNSSTATDNSAASSTFLTGGASKVRVSAKKLKEISNPFTSQNAFTLPDNASLTTSSAESEAFRNQKLSDNISVTKHIQVELASPNLGVNCGFLGEIEQ